MLLGESSKGEWTEGSMREYDREYRGSWLFGNSCWPVFLHWGAEAW